MSKKSATEIVVKLVKNRQITPEDGTTLIKEITSSKKNTVKHQDIAVIGMSGQFPDAQNVNEYWTNLATGRDSVVEIPEDRWPIDQFYDPDPEKPNRSYSKWSGLLDNFDKFDPSFFKISPREAELMDPQQRLFLQEAWRALEDAGYSPQSLDGKKCGVFVGCSTGDYQHQFADNQIFPQAYSLLGNITSVLASRISYLLNLKGPSIAIDTACSSSLVAIHLACESIRSGISEMALAGGVMIYSTPFNFIWASKMGILSPEGRCKTFDQHADGIAISECVGAVILKPLDTALTSGDNIIGVIKGTGINQDGNTDPGITAPSASAQAELENEIYRKYNIHPESISYLETHGTGTVLGDPIEIDGLTQAFRKDTQKKQYCAIGSVKTNIGHTQIAAGIAGFIKLLLCLKHKKLVPSLHFEKENEHLNLSESPFYVNTELKDWTTLQGTPRRAALSSFGFSGTNAHLVVEEYISQRSSSHIVENVPQLIVLSAANEKRLQLYAQKIRDFLNIEASCSVQFSFADFAYTLQVGREAMTERLALIADSSEKAVEKLTQYIEGNINQLYRANVKSNGTHSKYLHEGGKGKELDKIAQQWVTGQEIDWELLHKERTPQRLSLPTYPFAKEHYWIPVNESHPKKTVDSSTNSDYVSVSTSQPFCNAETLCYQTWWEPQVQASCSSSLAPLGIVLLFDLDETRYSNFKVHFGNDVILVTPGEHYQKLAYNMYTINPHHPEDYRQLLASLNHEPSYIVHLWSQSQFSSAELNFQLKLSIFSIFYLTQALLLMQPKKQVQLLYVHLASKELQPHHASLSGFINTVHQESSKLSYKTVALSSLENISKIVLDEFQTPDTQIWYKEGHRWIKKLQLFEGANKKNSSYLLKENGVYLITGGAGGLGLVFAEYLAKNFKARLILTGRSPLSQKQEDKINVLNALGAKVVYKRTDVSKRVAVNSLISQIKSEFNVLNGIIHGAGIIKNALITQKTTEDIDAVLAPKVYGTVYLDEATQNEPLDFFVLFSSVIAIMDNIGQGDYAYANAFMDHFAEKREQLRITGKRFGKTLSINWPLWQQGGMQVDHQTEKWLADTMGMFAISNDMGVKTFLQGLESETSQLIVIEGDRKKITKALGSEDAVLDSACKALSKTHTEKNQSEELQQTLLEIVSSTLKIDKDAIDLNEDISNYGADSITSIMIANQINERYAIDLSATLLFDYPSLSSLTQFLCNEHQDRFSGYVAVDTVGVVRGGFPVGAAKVEDQEDEAVLSAHEGTVTSDVFDEEFSLSYDQQAQWFSQQKDKTTSAYNLSISQRITSSLDIAALEKSFQFMIVRHPLLRAVFVMKEDGQLVQRIRHQQRVAFKVIDASGWSEEELKQKVIEADKLPFDLANGPLFRIHLFSRTEQDHVLLITMHHIIFDGWSGAIVIEEMSKVYPAIAAGNAPDLPVLQYEYKDYIQWYTEFLEGPESNIQWQYWQKQLSGELPVLQLSTDYPRPQVPTQNGDIHFFQLEDTLINQLKTLASDKGTTLYSLLLAAFQAFLYDCTGQEDIIVGSPFAIRNNYKFTGIVGDFVNMVALRSHCNEQIDFSSFLTEVNCTVQDALRYSEYPFQLLVERLQPKRVSGYSPVFQAVFVLQKPLFKNSPWLTMDPTVDTFDWAGLEAQGFIIPTAAGRFDLLLEMVDLDNTLVSWLNYNSDLFNADTIAGMVDRFTSFLQGIVQNPEQPMKTLRSTVQGRHNSIVEQAVNQQQLLAITATFTAEPLKDSLDFWMQQLGISWGVSFAPYNQVFQQLLDPSSLLAGNQQGSNIVLVRFEDWVEHDEIYGNSQSDGFAKIEKNVRDLGLALKGVVQNAAIPYLLCICPASPMMMTRHGKFIKQMERLLENILKECNSLYLVKSAELLNSYPVAEFYDTHGDKEGRVPYTPAFFTAIGTVISRKIYALRQKPYKVIVLDCDNTIWHGVCGEDGPLGVKISLPFQELQAFMLEQQAAGVLLCLCSKNVEEDVFAVFDQRSEMPIKREHLVSWRINWQPKSKNIKSLAQELQLGLDSFIFIDDNPVECAEVQASCPEVLTIQLPDDVDSIPSFLRHIWAFDRLKVTSEDQQRTAFYQQNVQREQLRQQAMTLEGFLESLELQIHITEMQPTQIGRVSQMTQRTNQFNATTIRRSENEIQQLAHSEKYTLLVVEVKDRFGDYGLVGLVIFTMVDSTLEVDTFLVSCRVLGRGVEHNMLAKLGEIAQQQGMNGVKILYKQTLKNKPIRNFLESVAYEQPSETYEYFWFPSEFCKAVAYHPTSDDDNSDEEKTLPNLQSNSVGQADSALLHRIATQLSDPEHILGILESEKHDVSERKHQIVTPRTETEAQLVELWKKVLRVESVGIYDNFFELGGNSLLAVKLMYYLHQTFHTEIPLSRILNAPVIADLSKILEHGESQENNTAVKVSKQVRVENKEFYPLSYGQQALWFLYQSDMESAAYNVALPLRIHSEINMLLLQNAFQALVNRHPCLRTTFTVHNGNPLQKINQYQLIPFEWIDASSWSQEKIQTYLVDAYQKTFDLENGPLLRVHLLTVADNDHILLLTVHHIVVDGVSIWTLIEELGQLYALIKSGRQPLLSPLEYSYADFVSWQVQLIENKSEQLWDYWKTQLAGELPILSLPTDYPRPNTQSYQGASVHFVITNPLMSQLKKVAKNEQVSFYTVLLGAYKVLLYRYTGQTDILVGSPATGRTQSEFSGIVGYFVNMLVLRSTFEDNVTFQNFLKQLQQTVIDALEHQDYPFMLLVERLQPDRDSSRAPIFQVDFAFQQLQKDNNLDVSSSNEAKFEIKTGELEFETFELGQQEGLFDLTLDIIETEESLIGTFMYSTDLFNESTIKQMVQHFQVLLEGIAVNTSLLIPELPLLHESEYQQVKKWNNTEKGYPQDKCVHQLFEEQVEQTPDALAVMFEGQQQLTYTLLNKKANQLAHYLQSQQVNIGTVVGICVERSLDMVFGLLGILKAGGIYLPLDPVHPTERIAFMLDDANVSILLTQKKLADKFSSLNTSVLYLDTEESPFSQLNTDNPVNKVNIEDLAYVIYTSGSTGTPKGVMLKHQGLLNHNQAIIEQYKLTSDDRCLQFASVNFDVATEEIFPTLLSGATLAVAPAEGFNSFSDFQVFIDNNQITVLNLPASYWHEWVLNLSGNIPPSLRLIVVGSEKVSLESLKIWQKLDGHHAVEWFNAYGPTEATITTTLYQSSSISLHEHLVASVPIGHPIPNTQVYILDHHLQLVPIGVPGELHIGGIGLAQGYLNNPTLTAEKFIANPFDKQENSRLYKTGDLARYLPDGTIEYLERLDHQVKLRGFRIEIGEIEAALMQHPDVQETVVNLFENRSAKYLVAYIVPMNRKLLDETQLHSALVDYLEAKLPDYMVPKKIMILEVMPLTSNGKINRKALPEPDVKGDKEYASPRSEVEQQLYLIWRDVLRHELVSIHDNFFELGGDSIRSLQIVAKAKEHGLVIKTIDIFQFQTIAELAKNIKKDRFVVEVDQGIVTGKVPLTPIQKAFFARNLPQPGHYNQFVLLETFDRVNIDHLRQTFAALLSHHDALRFVYHQHEGQWLQTCESPFAEPPLFIEDFSDVAEVKQLKSVMEKAEHYQAGFNLDNGPLSCMVVFKLGKSTCLFWCIHHLLVDGISWRILLNDLQTAYQQISQGMPVEFPQKTSSFKSWAENLTQYAQSEALSRQMAYWKDVMSSPFALPIDYAAGMNIVSSTSNYMVSLDNTDTAMLLKEIGSAYRTGINDLLLTALALTLSDWTKQNDCLIELESHGRRDLFKELDISRTVGWFTSIYPVQLCLPKTDDLGNCIQAIKEQLRQVPDEGISYGLLQHCAVVNQTCLAGDQAGQILFNYLGQFDSDSEDRVFNFVTGEESFGLSQSHQGNRDYLIEINGAVRNGRLYFYWSYSKNVHNETTIQKVADNYIENISKLIGHCKQVAQQECMAPSALLSPIRTEGEKKPFFCIPGMQGVPRYLYPLAHQLDKEQPFYSLYAPEIVKQTSCVSVEKLAARYIGAIKTIQPYGPYQIGGHSFGGVVAFEIVRQLENAHEEVSLLVLLDESAPLANAKSRKKTESEELLDYLKWLAHFNEIEMYDGNFESYTSDQRFELAVKYLNQSGLALDRQELETTFRAFTNNYKCYNSYIPQGNIVSRVVLLQSQEQNVECQEDGLGWQAYVKQPIEVVKVSGGHFSMLTMPHVKEVAGVMLDILK
ncbi:MAG: amino acid adenylation domain-containing protein [Candidatus Electrothrix sp. LOE1_4_5]|nr:amino acid adenylation domain-containing protein [Candidatus Electrothrix gigas]